MEMSCNRSEHRECQQGLRLLVVAAFLCLLGAAHPAWAAQVVEVRVGQHEGFSRVVLEFDSPVSYQVKPGAPAGSDRELLISLDASAQAETLRPLSGAIESVEIVPVAERRSTLRMKLSGENFKLKEMILSNPPRIVLDILEKTVASAAPESAPTQVAASGLSGEGEALESSRPVSAQPPASLSSEAALEDALREVKRKLALGEKKYSPTPEIKLDNEAPGKKTSDASKNLPTANPFLSGSERVAPKPMVETSPARPAPPPARTARPQATPPQPVVMPVPSGSAGQFSIRNVTVGAVGVLLLAGAGFVFMRSRNRVASIDDEMMDVSTSEDENPFSGLSAGEEVQAETEEVSSIEAADVEVGIPIPEVDAGPEILALEPEGTVGDAPDAADALAGFETRIAAMKARIDELSDAKQRLEHQVAAQTEELRVQRAAIARTQRAVRNLSRPGEDAPTEPALRDPSRPEGPRED